MQYKIKNLILGAIVLATLAITQLSAANKRTLDDYDGQELSNPKRTSAQNQKTEEYEDIEEEEEEETTPVVEEQLVTIEFADQTDTTIPLSLANLSSVFKDAIDENDDELTIPIPDNNVTRELFNALLPAINAVAELKTIYSDTNDLAAALYQKIAKNELFPQNSINQLIQLAKANNYLDIEGLQEALLHTIIDSYYINDNNDALLKRALVEEDAYALATRVYGLLPLTKEGEDANGTPQEQQNFNFYERIRTEVTPDPQTGYNRIQAAEIAQQKLFLTALANQSKQQVNNQSDQDLLQILNGIAPNSMMYLALALPYCRKTDNSNSTPAEIPHQALLIAISHQLAVFNAARPYVSLNRMNQHQLSTMLPRLLPFLEPFLGYKVAKISLCANQLTGPIPVAIGSLMNLTYLDLSNNLLSGSIPVAIGSLVNLTWLNLSYNQLTGPIPASIGNLIDLSGLNLSENKLTGPIPASIGNLINLSGLQLSKNELTGPIPASIGNLPRLTSFHLNNNYLTGPIPPALRNKPGLTISFDPQVDPQLLQQATP